MSGHSKWSSIKHKKGAADAKRGKLFSKRTRAIIIAARDGGPDPAANLAIIVPAFAVCLVVGTFFFVRSEQNR